MRICHFSLQKNCKYSEKDYILIPQIGCTECLLASINQKLDSTLPLQKKALETWIDLMKFIVKEIKKDRKKP